MSTCSSPSGETSDQNFSLCRVVSWRRTSANKRPKAASGIRSAAIRNGITRTKGGRKVSEALAKSPTQRTLPHLRPSQRNSNRRDRSVSGHWPSTRNSDTTPPFVTLTRASGFRLNMSHAEVVLTRRLLYKQNLNSWRNYETNTDLVCGRGGVNGRCFTPDSFSRATWISAACCASRDSRPSRG